MKKIAEYDAGLMLFGDMVYFTLAVRELELFLTSVGKFLKQSARRLIGRYDRLGFDRGSDYEDALPFLLYTSVITATISLLEREMQTIAEVLQRAADFPLSFADLSGSWIERFPKYCKSAAGLDIRKNQEQWQDISDAVALRNCLIHSDGYISDSNVQSRRAVSFLKRHHHTCVKHKHIVPNDTLSRNVLALAGKFIEEVYRLAQDKYPQKDES